MKISKINRGGRPPIHDWSKIAHLLGKAHDTTIAKILGNGCTDVAVLKHRKKIGIPPFQPRNGFDRRGRRIVK
jgi:hypothetical protein